MEANPEDRAKAERMFTEITKMETEFRENQKRKETILLTLTALEKAKITHSDRYQESLQSETESSRANLRFLESTHLDSILGQTGIETLLEQINAHKETIVSGSEKLTLQTKWEDLPQKQLLAKAIGRLTGVKLFKENEAGQLDIPIKMHETIQE